MNWLLSSKERDSGFLAKKTGELLQAAPYRKFKNRLISSVVP